MKNGSFSPECLAPRLLRAFPIFLCFLPLLSQCRTVAPVEGDSNLGDPSPAVSTPMPGDGESFAGDSVGYIEGGPAWATLLLPPSPQKPLFERDLLVNPNRGGWLAEGDCRWAPGWAEPAGSLKVRTVEIVGDLHQPASRAGMVLFFVDRASHELVGLGYLGATGKTSCRFNPERVVVSAGTGAQRMEWDPLERANESSPLILRVVPQGELRVEGAAEIAGDMLRIGRKPAWVFDEEMASLGSYFDNDLFRSVLGAEENAGVSEYLVTTFLLGKSGLRLALPEGNYVATFLRNGATSVCISEFSIAGEKETKISCDWTSQTDRSLRSWSRLNSLSTAPQFFTQPRPVEFLKNRGQIFAERRKGEETLAAEDLILPAAGPQNPEQACGRVANLSSVLTTGVGFREEDLRRGITPFITSIALPSLPASGSDWRSSFAFLGNGSEVRVRGLRSGSVSLMDMPTQQKIRASIFVPPGNATNQGMVFVNGRPLKRFSISRSALWAPAFHEVEEQFNFREDFEFSVCVWGVSFLPELVYGFRGILPFASSRPVCVDVDGDGQCGA